MMGEGRERGNNVNEPLRKRGVEGIKKSSFQMERSDNCQSLQVNMKRRSLKGEKKSFGRREREA